MREGLSARKALRPGRRAVGCARRTRRRGRMLNRIGGRRRDSPCAAPRSARAPAPSRAAIMRDAAPLAAVRPCRAVPPRSFAAPTLPRRATRRPHRLRADRASPARADRRARRRPRPRRRAPARPAPTVPTAAPAPSCGAPETSPEAMPGRRCRARTRRGSPASATQPVERVRPRRRRDDAAEIVGADADDDGEHHHLDAGADDIAEHALGEERGPFQSANGTSTKPARLVSLNSRIVTNSCTARMKKATITITQAIISTAISTKLVKKATGPTSSPA